MKLGIGEIIGLWFNGILQPEKAMKTIDKKKPGLIDGVASVGLIGLLAGIIISVFGYLGTSEPTILILIVIAPLLAIVGLLIWAVLFRGIAGKMRGKGKFDSESGLFGVLAGMLIVAMIPGVLIMALAPLAAIPTGSLMIYFVILGIGTMVSGILSYIVTGVMFGTVSELEKVTLPKTGFMIGLAYGIIMLIVMVAMGALFSIMIPAEYSSLAIEQGLTGF